MGSVWVQFNVQHDVMCNVHRRINRMIKQVFVTISSVPLMTWSYSFNLLYLSFILPIYNWFTTWCGGCDGFGAGWNELVTRLIISLTAFWMSETRCCKLLDAALGRDGDVCDDCELCGAENWFCIRLMFTRIRWTELYICRSMVLEKYRRRVCNSLIVFYINILQSIIGW